MRGKGPVARRDFLKGVAVVAAAPYVITSSALGAGGQAPASERIVMGCIGVGGQGSGDMPRFLSYGDVQVVAACDVDAARRDAARNAVERHYAAAGAAGTYKGCSAHTDFREVIAREDIDAVCIAAPDHWHALMSIAAAQAGKDVFCEKPLSLTVADGRAMVSAVRRFERVLQTGTQRRSSEVHRRICELVRNGRIGKLHTVEVSLPQGHWVVGSPPSQGNVPLAVPPGLDYDMWLGPAPWAPYTPMRCHFNFRWIYDYSGGFMTDWGAHYNDLGQWGSDNDSTGPVEIDGRGVFPPDGLFDTATSFRVEYKYANGVRLICETKSPTGVRFIGTEGCVGFADDAQGVFSDPPSVWTSVIGPREIHLYKANDHHGNFLDCVRTRKDPSASVDVGHRSASMCHLGNISMWLGRKLQWDPVAERFVNDAGADRLLSRALRSPWRL